jgi:hypothetical protein
MFCVVTAIYPIRAGAPPEKPPRIMFVWLFLFNHLLYTTILSNSPKTIRAKAQIFISQASANEIIVNIDPKINAFRGEILPEGIGLPLVLSITASISRSLKLVSVSAAADPAATPLISSTQIEGETYTSNNKDAVSAEANAVKTNRYQIFGFVSS